MKKVLVILDSQKWEFSSQLKHVYDKAKSIFNKVNYIFSVIPALKKLSKESELVTVALDSETALILGKNSIPYVLRSDFTSQLYDIKTSERAYDFVRKLSEKVEKFDTSFLYKGVNLIDLEEKNLWRNFVFPAIRAIDTFEEMVKKYKPQQVVVFDKSSINQMALAEVAKKHGIKVVYKAPYALDSYAKKTLLKYFGWNAVPRGIRNLVGVSIKTKESGRGKILISHDSISPSKIIPWAKKLAQKYEVVYVGTRESGKVFEENGIRYMRLRDYAEQNTLKEIATQEKIFENSYELLQENDDFKNSLVYNGIKVWPLLGDMFIYLHFLGYGILATYVELMKNMIDAEKPHLIITVDERSRFGRALVTIAETKKIKTMLVQHGLITDHPLFAGSRITKNAVYGKETMENLLKRGTKKSQIKIVGQAEEMPEYSAVNAKKEICMELGLEENKKMVIFSSQALQEEINRKPFEAIYSVMERFPEVQFVVKLHPDETKKLHEEMFRKFGVKNVTIVKDVNLKKLLLACDLLINIYSTVGIEAMCFGKPLISVNVDNLPEKFFPKKGSGIFIVKTRSELENAIKSVLNSKKDFSMEIMKKRRYYIAAHGEEACNNVVKLVESMIGK